MPTVRENIEQALAPSYALTGTPGPAHMGHLRSLVTTFHQALLALLEGDTPDPEPAPSAPAEEPVAESPQGPTGDAGGASETPSASEPTPPAEPEPTVTLNQDPLA